MLYPYIWVLGTLGIYITRKFIFYSVILLVPIFGIYPAVILSVLLTFPIGYVLLIILQPLVIKLLFLPYTRFLLASKTLFGGQYQIFLNIPGFISFKEREKAILNFRYCLFDLVKQVNPSNLKDKVEFTFETWIITQADIRNLRRLGARVERHKKLKKRYFLKLIYWYINRKKPPQDWEWYDISFGKSFVEKIHAYSSYSDYNKDRINNANI